MAKKYNWDSGETKEQLIRRLFPEYKLNKKSKWEKKLPSFLEITKKGKPIITPTKSRDFNTLELIENSLKRDINPVLNPEWGEELVLAVKKGEFQDLKSLEIFLLHCPLSKGFWNSFKMIYKLLEKRLIFLSKTGPHFEQDVLTEAKAIVKSLAIIFHRLDNKSRCTECNKFCQRARRASLYCDEPCETWEGGIRFTQVHINLNGKNVDTLKTRKEIISSQEGIKNAEIFKSRSTIANEFGEKLAALVLYDEKFSRKSFKNFLEKRKYEEADLPEVVHYFEYDQYSDNPWSSRGVSKTGAKSYRGSKLSDELYADLRSFIPTSKPSVKTIGYMRRRFRRLLRNFQTTDSDLYISLCVEFFKLQDYFQKDSISSQWLLTEILFGEDKDIKQRGHGRGNMSYPLDYKDNRSILKAPCYRQWKDYFLRNFSELAALIKNGEQPLLITEFLIEIHDSLDLRHAYFLRDSKIPDLKIKTLNRYLQSSSEILVEFAFKQLQLQPERANKIQPASIARGLVTLSVEEAEKYFESILSNRSKSIPDDWKQRFTYEIDDAIFSQQKDLDSTASIQKTLALGLLSLQFPWKGRIKGDYYQPRSNDLFKWNSDRMRSVWGKSNWSRPNTSLVTSAIIGWPHAIFDKALHGYITKPSGLDFQKYFSLADSQRLLDLLNLKIPLSRCSSYRCLDLIPADPRIEKCRACGQSLKLSIHNQERLSEAPIWLKKEILMYLSSHLHDIDNKELIKKIETLIDQDLLSENSVLLEQAISDNKFKLSSEQMANMLCGVNEENWDEKIDRGKRIPNETLKSQQFWFQLWEMIGEEQSPLIKERANTRFFTNPEMLNAITANFEPNVLDGLSEEQVAFIGLYLREKPEAFNIESTLLMKAATSSDSRIYEKAFSHLEDIGLQSKFALGLLESDFPKAIEEATLFFKELDASSPEFLEDLLSLCDSPNFLARSLGLEVLETSQDHIPLAKIIISLKESRHPDIRHFVATKLSANSELLPNSLDFDISVLKSRNIERPTKELVKERLQQGMPLNLEALDESLLKTLREMSQGLVEKDKEWAIKQLTGIKARGTEVPDLQIKEIEE